MAKSGTRIVPPAGGMVRSADFQRQPPFNTPHALNVCPDIGDSGLGVVGTRPGTTQTVLGQYGASGRVSTLVSMRYNESNDYAYAYDHADSYQIGSAWTSTTQPAWLATPLRDPLDHVWYQDPATMSNTGLIYKVIPSLLFGATEQGVQCEILALPTSDVLDATYTLYFWLNDANPQGDDGVRVVVRIQADDTSERWTLTPFLRTVQGATTSGTISTGLKVRDAISIRAYSEYINGAPTTGDAWLSVYLNSVQVFNLQDLGAMPRPSIAPTKVRFGWAMQPTTLQPQPRVDLFAAQFRTTTLTKAVDLGVAVIGGEVYAETAYGALAAQGGTGTFNDNLSLMPNEIEAVDRLGRVYFADNNAPASVEFETSCSISIGGLPSVVDFIPLTLPIPPLVSPANHVLYVRRFKDAGGNTVVWPSVPAGRSYEFEAEYLRSNSQFRTLRTASANWPGYPAALYADIWIKRSPSYYNPAATIHPINVMGRVRVLQSLQDAYYGLPSASRRLLSDFSLGEPPIGCHLIAEFKDRLYLAGYPDNQWFASRRGDPNDWGYLDDADPADPNAPVFDTIADEGQIGRKITALIGHTDDIMVWGCDSAIFRLRGDPGYGGALNPVTTSCGILGSRAWCIDDQSVLRFAAPDGIYKMPGDASAFPIPISANKLPNELRHLDPKFHLVQMVYDQTERCVNIFVGGHTTNERRQWWRMDIDTEGFWAMKFPDGIDPLAAHWRTTGYNSNFRGLWLGGRDGLIRTTSRRYRTDSRTAITSKLVIGPIRSSSALDMDAKVDEVACAMADGSGRAILKCYAANTAPGAVNAAVVGTSRFSHTVGASLNLGIRPKMRGPVYCLSLEDVNGSAWSVSELNVRGQSLGKVRV